jgi:hypothetical protein
MWTNREKVIGLLDLDRLLLVESHEPGTSDP